MRKRASRSRMHLSHPLSNMRLESVRLGIGDVRTLDKLLRVDEPDHIAAFIVCGGRCGLSRRRCLTRRRCLMEGDRRMMRSQELRYDSWMQTVKQGYFWKQRAAYNEGLFRKAATA